MIAGEALPHGATFLHVDAPDCKSHLEAIRNARLEAARAYMRALGASIAAGELMCELRHDHNALSNGGGQLLDLARTRS